LILDLSQAISGSVHDFRIFKEHGLPRPARKLLRLMGRVIIWADSAYEAIPKYHPDWDCRINEKAKRNHPLTQAQRLNNTCKTRIRIAVEHVIRRIKIFRCCAEKGRNLNPIRQTQYWHIVAGLCNQRQAETLGITAILN
jgi:hypothetical protein